MWPGIFSSSCGENNAIGEVFAEFQNAFYQAADNDCSGDLDPVVREDWSRTAFKRPDGWTMEEYVGKHWSMTAYSKWFEEDGKGYTVQVRSKAYLDSSSYDIVLYDEAGKRLASIEENECLTKIKGKYSERQHLHLIKGALEAISGRDVEIKVSQPTGWMWIWEEVEVDELTES